MADRRSTFRDVLVTGDLVTLNSSGLGYGTIATSNTNISTTSTTPVSMAGTDVTPPAAGRYMVFGQALVGYSHATDPGLVNVVVRTKTTGTIITSSEQTFVGAEEIDGTVFRPVTLFGIVDWTSADGALELAWSTTSGATAGVDVVYARRLMISRINNTAP